MKTSDNLTTKQLLILTHVYQFRFVTTFHIKNLLKLSNIQSAGQRLNLLTKNELLGRHYSPEDKLNGRPATYFLLPKGIRALKNKKPNLDKNVLHNIYRDRTATPDFVYRHLMTSDIYTELSKQYGRDLTFFTSSELAKYEYMPKPLSDAYATLSGQDDTFFLQVSETTTPMYMHRKTIQRFIEYAESGDWEDGTKLQLPIIIFVCDSDTLQRKLQRIIERELEDTFEENLVITTVTLSNIKLQVRQHQEG